MFKRKIYDKLTEWKNESNGKTALLIEGARRIGKSTVTEEFAKNEYESYILIDFARVSKNITELFDDISDLNFFFLQLQLYFKTDLKERKSLIVFDEIQLCPKARQAIKYLVADGRYDYIETGSLISIKKNVKDILIPSEERKIKMYPMDYEEFLWALGDEITSNLIKICFDSGKSIGEQLNRKLMRYFRLYMLVGGMPQAVSEYLNTNNFKSVDAVKRDIIDLYESDFAKIDGTGRLSAVFDSIPAQLNSNSSRYHISEIYENGKTDIFFENMNELKESGTVLIAYHANDPNIDLSSNMNLTKFKLFVCDTGLFTTLMFKNKDFTENVIYEKLLNDKLSTNLGYLYENVVAQTLASTGNNLFYYTFANKTSGHNYEIDFLLSRKNKIMPLEVKSSGYKAHKSLDKFCEKYSDRISDRYVIYTKDYAKEKETVYLPVYMCRFL